MKLTNEKIFRASSGMRQLFATRRLFPVMVSNKLAKLAQLLDEKMEVINQTQKELVKKYGEKDEITGQLQIARFINKMDEAGNKIFDDKKEPVKVFNPAFEKYEEEWAEFRKQEEEITFTWNPPEKIKLPEKIAATCDKCHHNMDRVLEIEPEILFALADFIEI